MVQFPCLLTRRAETTRAVADTVDEFIDVPLQLGARAVGQQIAELDLPREVVLVSIRRGQELVIPHGDTVLQVGDVVTALCESDYVDQVRAALSQSE